MAIKKYKTKEELKIAHAISVKKYSQKPEVKEKRKLYIKKYRNENRERLNKVQKLYKRKNSEKYKGYGKKTDLKRMYGITIIEYNTMLLNQNNSCAVCKRHKDEFKKALFVDHCHTTKKVRGLLCMSCNFALGSLNDSPILIENLLKYIKQ